MPTRAVGAAGLSAQSPEDRLQQHRTASWLLALGALIPLAGSAAPAPPAFEVEVINDAATALPVTIESSDPVPVSIESTAAPADEVILLKLRALGYAP